MTFLENYRTIMTSSSDQQMGGASQEQLDEVGHLLDRLEELEIYYNSPSLTTAEAEDTFAEMTSLFDQLDSYMEII